MIVSRPVRVVHVSSAHRSSDVRIHLREAASLAKAGYNVTLVAVGHDIELPQTGVRVVKLRERERLQRVTIGTADAVWTALRTGAKVFHLHDPELVWAILPLRLLGKWVIYDAHEDLPRQMLTKSYMSPFVRIIAAGLSQLVIKVASLSNHVIAATEKSATTFPSYKVSLVRNYPRLRTGDRAARAISERSLHVAYIGVMSEERGALQMVDSFESANFPQSWRAMLAGPTTPEGLLNEMRERQGWRHVDYHGFLSTDGARDLLLDCRVGICVLQRTESYLDSLPTKMFEYFAAGMPVVASDFPLWRSIVEEHNCGLLVDETSPDAIAEAISRYDREPELLREHAANALRAAEQILNWEKEEETLLRVYAQLVRGRKV
jgi:glycosyltransferase involved in cell wall biosynthesis